MSSENKEIKARLKTLIEWTKKEVEGAPASSCRDAAVERSTGGVVDPAKLPATDEDAGIEEKFLRLCATMAGGVYKTTSKKQFEYILNSVPEIGEQFPNLSLRFYQTGVTIGSLDNRSSVSLSAPTLAGVIVGETLVLAYRGTVTIADMVNDIRMTSVEPWKPYKGLEVQRAYYNLIKTQYFGGSHSHKKDIINYVNGNYSKVLNRTEKNGTPIKRILITGHSLGGGLAQVTHFCLTAKGGDFDDLVSVIEENKVQVQTVAFAAPMTTVLSNPSKETEDFLDNSIRDNMRNICFKTDPVPRGYANIGFILDLLEDIKDKFLAAKSEEDAKQIEKCLSFFKEGLLPWAAYFLEGQMDSVLDQAKKYQHVGKVLYYDREGERPASYIDCDVCPPRATQKFRDLKYQPSLHDPIQDAYDFHMYLVKENGLGFVGSVIE